MGRTEICTVNDAFDFAQLRTRDRHRKYGVTVQTKNTPLVSHRE